MAALGCHDIDNLESQEMVEEADRNNDGVVDKEEFFRVMRRRGDDPLDDLDSDSDFWDTSLVFQSRHFNKIFDMCDVMIVYSNCRCSGTVSLCVIMYS